MKTSKKRIFPNALTILNMFLGFVSIILIIRNNYIDAGLLLILAGLMDIFDGKVARGLGISSKFGVEFDSFADTVSFCIAPSILIYSLYIDSLHFLVGLIFCFIPLICGTIRLAKYNLDSEDEKIKNYFIGLSTPISTTTILAYMFFNYSTSENEYYGDPIIGLILVFFLGALMLSPIHFIKFPLITFKYSLSNSILLVIMICCSISIIIWKGLALLPVCLAYIFINIFFWFKNNRIKNLEINI